MTNPYKARRILPPIPSGYPLDDVFSVLVPVARTNLIANPSLETNTTGWTAVGGSIARSATQQYHGAYSLAVTPTAGTSDGCYYGTVTLTLGQLYAVSAKVYGQAGVTYKISVATTGGADLAAYQFVATGRWQWVWIYWQEPTGAARRVYITKVNSSDTHVFYIDGAQVEAINAGETVSTYLDGDQQGLIPNQYPPPYGWNGTPHASTSYRTALTRSGGQVMRFKDYGFVLTAIIGLGLAVPENVTIDYAQLDGGQDVYTRKPTRTFSLAGRFEADSYFQLRDSRSAVTRVLDRDRAALDQPLMLLHHLEDRCGGVLGDEARIVCKYQGGLGGNTQAISGEVASMQFQQVLPLVLSDRESGASISVQTTVANANYILQRSAADVWSALGSGGTGGTIGVTALAYGQDGTLYAGGDFTGMGGVANTNNIASWNGSAWSALGTGVTGAGASVNQFAVGPDGTLYAGGTFLQMSGVANTQGIAKWDGANWTALGTGMNGSVLALAVGPDGSVYAGGAFTLAGGVANTVRIAKWNGSAWSALSTGMNNEVRALTVGPDGTLYAGGLFSTAGGASAAYIAEWNGSAWSAMGTGMNSNVLALKVGLDGLLYAGGQFTTAGGVSANQIARWNGAGWAAVGTGTNGNVLELGVRRDGGVLVGGSFSTINGITVTDGIAVWLGGTFLPLNVDLPGSASVLALLVSPADVLTIGYNTTGSATVPVVTGALTNVGTARAYPTITIKGPSSGTSRIYEIRNSTTGRRILLNYTINAGETAILRFDPDNLSFTSDFQGNLLRTILPGSDTADFFLAPGSNTLSFYAAGATVTAIVAWRPRYASLDDVP